jgi:hypothetical protein
VTPNKALSDDYTATAQDCDPLNLFAAVNSARSKATELVRSLRA